MNRKNLSLSQKDLLAIEREYCKRRLINFVRRAWHVIEPANPFLEGKAVETVCNFLEAVSDGRISRAYIAIPPGMAKSLLVSVFFPAWEWITRPHLRYVLSSNAIGLSIRDNQRARSLIKSEWYQSLFDVRLTASQDAKIKFENTDTGFREASSFEGITGKRGDRVLIDDPINVLDSGSDVIRETINRLFEESVQSRINAAKGTKSAIVIIAQRLHEDDIIARAKKHGYEGLVLPMEYEGDRCKTSIGDLEWRKEHGELLFPERFSREYVNTQKSIMGSYATSAQFQQNPVPRTGGMFDVSRFRIVNAPPPLEKQVRYWDKAGTEMNGAYTAGVKIGRTTDGQFVILDVQRGQWSSLKRERIIKQTAEIDGKDTHVWIEQEPGSGGVESAESTIRNLQGFVVHKERVTGDKITRAQPYEAQVEGGQVMILKADWNRDFIEEHRAFPGKYKDQVDASAGAFNKLLAKRAPSIRQL